MNGAHDMGGVMGFGRVVLEPNEPVFHFRWEGRVPAMMSAMAPVMGATIDQGRFEREDVSPAEYVLMTYYETWFVGLVRMPVVPCSKRRMTGEIEESNLAPSA
jgi:nitrile hydratase